MTIGPKLVILDTNGPTKFNLIITIKRENPTSFQRNIFGLFIGKFKSFPLVILILKNDEATPTP